MKPFILIAALVFNYAFAKAQDSSTKRVETPMIGVKLMYGDAVDFGDVQIRFKKVITDSRCPKDVLCVWEGEAKVLVEVYRGGILDSEKELRFAAINANLGIVDTENLGVSALRLQPYPNTAVPKNNEEYYLLLNVRGD